MNEESGRVLVSQIAALVEQFERRCEQTGQQLQQLVQQVPGTLRQSADAQLQRLPGEVMQRVQAGMDQPVNAYDKRLRETGEQLQKSAQALALQLQHSQVLHKRLVWKVAGITLGSLVLLLAGGGWLLWHYAQEIKKNQVAAELLRAYNQADVTLCDGRLCAKMGKKDKRFGDYVPVEPR